ncbi:MAG: hypothetical protein GY865_02795, partial [candidate division Zixibacteria bacterium]|nr:hypothetical protein [candidate division Zixibacteria bacterium]
MQKTLLFAVVFISMINFHLNAFVINVPEDQPTIQDGINSSTNGDTILVASNVYYENINFNGKNIVVASHFILDSDYDYIHSTTIDGSNYSNQDTTSTVLIISGEDSNAVLQGFTIRGGEGSKWIDPDLPQYTWRGGGGILIFMASPIIKNNIIVDNAVTNTAGVDGAQGGGLLCYGGNPQIINNVIMGNEANYGAGMVVDYSGAIIKNN